MFCRLVCVAVVVAAITAAAHAELHTLGTLPGKPGKAAYTLAVDIESDAGSGYEPLRLTFSPRGRTFARDHRVSIRVSPRNNFLTSLDMAFDSQFTLPQGATQQIRTIYVPYYYAWDTVVVTLFEDGRRVETGKGHFNASALRTRDAQQTTSVGVIIPEDAAKQKAAWQKCPDVRTLTTVLGDGPLAEDVDVKRLSQKDSLALLQDVQPAWVQFRPIEESELHSSWLGYSQLDVIIVAAPALARIESSQPGHLLAIQDWIAAGGNLWVYATSNATSPFLAQCNGKRIPSSKVVAGKRIPGMLDLKQKNDTSELNYEYYQGVRKRSQDYASQQMLDKMSTRQEIFKKMGSAQHPFADITASALIASKVTTTKYGLGTVTSIDDEDPFPGSYQFWNSISRLYASAQINWLERNGLSPSQGNLNYWAWLIASVGKPPVKSFILLNTLFVIVIGPLAYFFFQSRERLYLLFFFAPVFAMLVTLSLFGYAMLADGTTTRLRTRQLTWLDSNHEIATTRTRQTYYAVLGSGQGLSFADDVAVFPILHSAAIQRYQYHNSDREPSAVLTSANATQKLSGSFLPARNQVQYATIHPDSLDAGLSVDMQSDPPTVTNGFSFGLHKIVVCDGKGQFWSSAAIAAAATAKLGPASTATVQETLDDRVFPDPADVPMLNANRNNPTMGDVGLLEKKLMQWSRRFPAGHFIATADLIDDELGASDATIKNSVHVIMGELP